MPAGKLNYVYRLTTARVVILRMRMMRNIRRLLRLQKSPSKAIAFSKSAIVAGTIMTMAALGFVGWLGYQLPHPVQVSTAEQTGRPEPETVLPAPESIVDEQQVDATLVSGQIASLEKALIIKETENVSLKRLLSQKVSEIESLQVTTHTLNLQLEELEQETAQLEFSLNAQAQRYAEAEAQWKDSGIERKVVYNITNIPVGGHVSEEQMRTDVQEEFGEERIEELELQAPSPGEASALNLVEEIEDSQAYTYPFGADGSDINSVDAYQQYRDTTGDRVGWKGDDYLSDALQGGVGSDESRLSDDSANAESYQQTSEDEESNRQESINAKSSFRRETFFGPAPDRYEDLVDPSMANLPVDAEPVGRE